MQPEEILFLICGAITLAAALVAVIRRDAFQSALSLLICCIGVAALFLLMAAPVMAALQVLFYGAGIAALIRLTPQPLKEMTRPARLGLGRRWWLAAVVMVALLGTLSWAVLTHDWSDLPGTSNSGSESVAALGALLVDPEGFLLPIGLAVGLLLLAAAGAAKLLGGLL